MRQRSPPIHSKRKFRIGSSRLLAPALVLACILAGCSTSPQSAKTSAPHEGKALGSSSSNSAIPECEQYGLANVSQQAKASACLYWYNETTSNLSLGSNSCADGHITTGWYDGWPSTWNSLPTNSFLTQDFDPNNGEGGNTRVQCTLAWDNSAGTAVATVNFNMDYYSSPTSLGVNVVGQAPGVSIHINQAGHEPNTASITICTTSDTACSGQLACPDGADWMSCEFGNPTNTDSPPLAQVSMPGAHDSGTWGIWPSIQPIIDRCGGSPVDASEGTAEQWAQTQVGNNYAQAETGARYFDVRGVDEEGYMEHCHSIGAQSWANIFGITLNGKAPDSGDQGLVQFANAQPGEVMTIDFTHMYDNATPGTAPYNEAVAELKTLCNYAVPTDVIANPGTTPINTIRAYSAANDKPFLFYMVTSDSDNDGVSTDPYTVYNQAVPNCLRSESASDGGGGIQNNGYDTQDNADPMNDYVSPAIALASPGSDFNNFENSRYNEQINDYQTLPSNNSALDVQQYILNYDPYTVSYLLTDNLQSWTQFGLASSYSQDAFPVASQFITGLARAAAAKGMYPNVVLTDFVSLPFWGNTMAQIWNLNSGRPAPGPLVTVNIATSGGVAGSVHDTQGFSCSTSSCTAQLSPGDVLYANPGTGTWSGSACVSPSTTASCTLVATGVATENYVFTGSSVVPGVPTSVTLAPYQTGIEVNWSNSTSVPITISSATAYAQGTTMAVGSCSSFGGACAITNLSSTTSYYVQVTSHNNYGAGPPSTTSTPQYVTAG